MVLSQSVVTMASDICQVPSLFYYFKKEPYYLRQLKCRAVEARVDTSLTSQGGADNRKC